MPRASSRLPPMQTFWWPAYSSLTWSSGYTNSRRVLDRMILRASFLGKELDQLVAACDAVSVVQLNKGPSGIMSKALTVGVPANPRSPTPASPPAVGDTFGVTLLGVEL